MYESHHKSRSYRFLFKPRWKSVDDILRWMSFVDKDKRIQMVASQSGIEYYLAFKFKH